MNDDLLTDKELKRETVKEPAKAWRNKWRTHCDGPNFDAGSGEFTIEAAGTILWGATKFPSQDIAETEALRIIAEDYQRGVVPLEYLGAFPVE